MGREDRSHIDGHGNPRGSTRRADTTGKGTGSNGGKGKKKATTPLVSLIAGGVAGGVESGVTYPFELAKTRMQLKATPTSLAPRGNPFKIVPSIIRNEGLAALYTGCTTMIVGTVGKDALRFLTFAYVQRMFETRSKPKPNGTSPDFNNAEDYKPTPVQNILSGLAAGVIASTFAVTPSERVKTALIDDARNARSPTYSRKFTGPIHAIRVLTAENGLLALYRGYVSTTAKQSLATALRLGTYAILKDYESSREIVQSTPVTFLNGAIAGIVTTYGTQPVDVVKTRAQSVAGAGIREGVGEIWREYGIRGFWRGTSMRLGRTVVSGGVLFSVYELVVDAVEGVMGEGGD